MLMANGQSRIGTCIEDSWPENESPVTFACCSRYVVVLASGLFEEFMAMCSCSLQKVVSHWLTLVQPGEAKARERRG
jgi:hypothetical protein